jgi:competence protein ComEA
MDIIGRINQRIGFTKTESRIVLFLAGMFLLGGMIRLIRGTEAIPAFDYTQQDAQFAAGVARLNEMAAQGDSSAGEERAMQPARADSQKTGTKRAGHSRLKNLPGAGSVNINTASTKDLMSLPGIGESIAERIILYRSQHGPFGKIEDLRNVKGIGEKKFAAIREYLTTGK